ncbi:MAG: helix-turn-helix domain-containing protein [Clostridia bacterium]|nr:helix-turn-helix domain-containing protein [Clostridia bacterium]
MEKKTIGKWIAILRKANGMTQKELAEKLFVSDKTVSRWERDECDPDLALIPVIADIFGITTDELLRGERKNMDKEENEGGRYALKGEKQFKNMVYMRKKKHDNLTLISILLSIVGFLVGILCNFGFLNGITGFVFAIIFLVASEVCQGCFMRNDRLPIDEDDPHKEGLAQMNAFFVQRFVQISWLNWLVFAWSLPFAMTGGNAGMQFVAWLGFGGIFCAVALILGYILYATFIHAWLVKKGYLLEKVYKSQRMKENVRRIRKISVVVLSVALCLALGIWILNFIGYQAFCKYETYTDPQAFIERMQGDYEKWFEEGYGDLPLGGEEYYERYKDWDSFYVEDGQMITYYYKESLYEKSKFVSGKKLPVTILTTEAYYDAHATFNMIQDILYIAILVDVVAGIGVYVVLTLQSKKKGNASLVEK